jgi:2-dehydropantoate 2-reductase
VTFPRGPVTVFGAGAIGCFIGGRLQAAGADVHFVGRPSVLDSLRHEGLTLTDLEARTVSLPPHVLKLHAEAPPGAALVLLCVKSAATAAAARALPGGSLVLSLQNGLRNAAQAAAEGRDLTVLSGMVPFNVAELGPGRYHRGTVGALAAQDHERLRPWLPLFEVAGLPLTLHADLRPIQWGKLLLNLNNPVNALSGLPLRAQLLDRDHRRVLAALQAEALDLMQAAGIQPARLTPLPPRRLLQLLRLPNWLFTRLAARMLRIDDRARSSMADDLARGRPTEIDALCGEVVRLAASIGRRAPLNLRMQQLVETDPRPRSGAELRREMDLLPPP